MQIVKIEVMTGDQNHGFQKSEKFERNIKAEFKNLNLSFKVVSNVS